MSWAELKVRIEAGRRFEHPISGVGFQLRVPTDHAWNAAVGRCRDANGLVNEAESQRAIVELGLTGWAGLREKHFPPYEGEAEVPYTPAARTELLDARPDWQAELLIHLCDRFEQQRRAREEARKNS